MELRAAAGLTRGAATADLRERYLDRLAPAADARAPDAPRRFGAARAAAMEARTQRHAERMQQRAAQRGPMRPEGPSMQPPVPMQMPAPVEAPPLAAPVERSRPGRLTPDERRALRQQINDAGRDIYRPERP